MNAGMTDTVTLREAQPDDAAALTAIAFAAKRRWDYPESWIELWADDLTITAAYIQQHRVLLACEGSQILGWCSLVQDENTVGLEHCWIEPAASGKGIGRALVHRVIAEAIMPAGSRVSVVSDPNAEGFYLRLGFQRVAEHASQPPGRRLPVLSLRVEDLS